MIFTLVAIECELVKIVIGGHLVDFVIQLISTREPGSLTRNHVVRVPAASGFAATTPNRGIGLASIGIHINPIFAVTLYLKCQIRRVDFEVIFIVEVPHADDNGPLRQLQLGGVVIDIKKCNAGFRIHANRSRTGLQFSPRILVSPQVVAGGQRTIGDSLYPVALATGLEGHRSYRIAEARNAAWRILCRTLLVRRLHLILRRRFLRGDSGRCLQRQQHSRQDNSNCQHFVRLHGFMFLVCYRYRHTLHSVLTPTGVISSIP